MKFVLIICITLMFHSCETNSNGIKGRIQLADKFSLPKDSLSFYFPANSFSDRSSSDSFHQNWLSSALYSFKEPILSRGFVGHNVCRFLWLRSFHRPVVFTLHENKGEVWLNTKMLDRQPLFYDNRILGIDEKEREEYIKDGYSIDKKRSDVLVKIADRKASIIYNKTNALSKQHWNQFQRILVDANFENHPPTINDGSTDGARWVIEVHSNSKYHFVDYPGVNDMGLFLIRLSQLEEEIY